MNIYPAFILLAVAVLATIFIRTDKRYAYGAAFFAAIYLVIRAFMNGDVPSGVCFGLLFVWLTYNQREVFFGPAEKRKWQNWPWS